MSATYTYLALNIATIFIPVLLSFDGRVNFYKKFLPLALSIGITSIAFIAWDIVFTMVGVWSFNDAYLIGIRIFHLPIEEWFFFITVPYACVFIYECLKTYTKDWLKALAYPITASLFIGLGLLMILEIDKMYTAVTIISFLICLGIHLILFKRAYLGYFFMTYLISLIPFLIVNGILTSQPVVIYNDLENIGLRIGTIPVEDTVYSMFLLLMNVTLYEGFTKSMQKGKGK